MTLKEAQQIAHGLMQGYIGPDHRVMDMPMFLRGARAGATGRPPTRLE
jgi:hypothetical protein